MRKILYFVALFLLSLPISVLIGSAVLQALWNYLDFQVGAIYGWVFILVVLIPIYIRFWTWTRGGVSKKKFLVLTSFFFLEILVYLSLM